MAQIFPWHSIKTDVHHNNTECNNGKNIQPEDRRAGTGDKPLCMELVTSDRLRVTIRCKWARVAASREFVAEVKDVVGSGETVFNSWRSARVRVQFVLRYF